MFFVLQSFFGALGNFEAGTERSFTNSTATLLRESGLITPVGSEAHQAWLAAQAAAVDEATETASPEGEPAIEAKPEPAAPALETKPAPVRKAKASK